MQAARPELACDDARLLASLALDGAVHHDARLRALWDHLGACAGCAAFAAQLGLATSVVRSSPLEPSRCELTSPRLLRSRLDAQRVTWTSAAVVFAAVVLGISQLPSSTDGPGNRDGLRAQSVAAPPKLPIGQRSAADDFATTRRTTDRAETGPRRS